MNKEQSADDPSVDLIRVKNMLNSTISMSYPDVVIACIEHKVSLEAFRAIEAALVKHDNNMKDYSWWLTDHHNCKSLELFKSVTEPARSLSLSGKW